jgi:GntP family gluconate:H+ symporter
MSSGIGLFLIIFLAISGMIVLISKFKWHPFIVLILSALFVGLTTGMGINDLIAKITT